jgi:hypothetical protein
VNVMTERIKSILSRLTGGHLDRISLRTHLMIVMPGHRSGSGEALLIAARRWPWLNRTTTNKPPGAKLAPEAYSRVAALGVRHPSDRH